MLTGRAILITGVASAIGHRAATRAVRMGAGVIGIDRVRPAEVVGTFVGADIGTAEGVETVVALLPSRLDALCLVAVAGTPGGAAGTIATNVFGARALAQAAAPHLRDGASVVCVIPSGRTGWRANPDRTRGIAETTGFPDAAGIVARFGIPDDAVDPVVREVLLHWTRRAAQKPLFKTRGIRVNAVSPGPELPPTPAVRRAVLGDAPPCGTAATADDIAQLAMFLCSDAARWINGAHLVAGIDSPFIPNVERRAI